MAEAAKFEVDSRSAAVSAMSESWPMIDALIGGTGAMRKAAKTFLPQWPKESDDSYRARLMSTVLFPAFSRTTEIMGAKPFSKPISVEGTIGPRVKAFLTNVDRFGTDVQPFAASVFLSSLRYGLTGVLVDCPPADGVRTVADEKQAGIRPYFTVYEAANILGWRVAQRPITDENKADTASVLLQLRLLEHVTEADGEFGEKIVKQVRVLEPGTWRTYRKLKVTDSLMEQWVLHERGTTTLNKIPFVFFYGARKGYGIGAPPLLDLAHMSVEHWQSSSDQSNILHVARVPILFAKGFQETDTLVVGASSAARSNSPDAELKWVEHTGAAIEAGRQSLLDLEDRMRQTGAELLVQKPKITTATQVTAEGDGSKSTLQQMAEDCEESLEQCIDLLGEWIKEPTEAEVKLFKDFGAASMGQDTGNMLLSAANEGHISSETLFEQMKRMNSLPHDMNWTDEAAKLSAQPPRLPQEKALAAKAKAVPKVKKPQA